MCEGSEVASSMQHGPFLNLGVVPQVQVLQAGEGGAPELLHSLRGDVIVSQVQMSQPGATADVRDDIICRSRAATGRGQGLYVARSDLMTTAKCSKQVLARFVRGAL